MKREELRLERPATLQACGPPERDGRARDDVRLLVSTARGHEHARFRDLPRFLERGSLLVVNRSTTLPASLPARHARLGPIVANVATRYGTTLHLLEPRWSATDTAPIPLRTGDAIEIAGVPASLVAPYPGAPYLWFARILGDLDAAMVRDGMPIRDEHVVAPYPPIEAYQTLFSRAPGSAEMPSAARPFTARVVRDLERKGIRLAEVTLHAGVSGRDVETDDVKRHVVPAEPFEVPATTAEAVNAARRDGRPVIAVGTTVVRALESSWDGERVRPAAGFTRVLIHPDRPARSVDGLLTGLHDPFSSHLAMLYAIAPAEMVRHGYAEAVREGYLWHEFGDSHLIAAGERSRGSTRFHSRGKAMSSHKHANEIGGPLALDWRVSLADRWLGRTSGSGNAPRAPRRCRSRS